MCEYLSKEPKEMNHIGDWTVKEIYKAKEERCTHCYWKVHATANDIIDLFLFFLINGKMRNIENRQKDELYHIYW